MNPDWLDNLLNTASDVGVQIIDTWGAVQVASIDAQAQPHTNATGDISATMRNSVSASPSLWIAGGVLLLAISYVVLKK
jgi:hypothetical protein